MWLLFGLLALLTTALNAYQYIRGKDSKLAMALALSFTALTLSSQNSAVSAWVKAEDWTALMDVVPSMAKVLTMLTVASIVLNVLPVILERRKERC